MPTESVIAILCAVGISLISFFFGMLFYRFMHKRVKKKVDHQRLMKNGPRRRRSQPT